MRWNSRPLTPNARTSRRASRAPARPWWGSIEAKGKDVVVLGGDARDLLVGVAREAGLALGVDGEDHRAAAPLAEMRRHLLDRRRHPVLDGGVPELRDHPVPERVIAVLARVPARLLGMGMEVEDDEIVEAHGVAPSSLPDRRSKRASCRLSISLRPCP